MLAMCVLLVARVTDWMLIEGVGVEIRTDFQKAVQSVKEFPN